jgi:L-arabinonolactonase
MVALVKSIKVNNHLGEGIIWDARSQELLWTDIEERTLFRLKYETSKIDTLQLPYRLCSFGLTEDPETIIAAFDKGFCTLDISTGIFNWISQPSALRPGSGLRLNDGRIDRAGRFWCGAMIEDDSVLAPNGASLYSLSSGHPPKEIQHGISISNAICWSPDTKFMYFADSPTRKIIRFDYDLDTGLISNGNVFSSTPEGEFPDGAVTDKEGYLWCAHWGGGKVTRYDPSGQIDQIVSVPASQPSCVAFGGPENNMLFVTSATQNMTKEALASEPEAGNLFIFETPYTGVSEPLFMERH